MFGQSKAHFASCAIQIALCFACGLTIESSVRAQDPLPKKGEEKPNAQKVPDLAALTDDEKTLLALASRPGSYFGAFAKPDVIRVPKMTNDEIKKLLASQFEAGGRGKRVATGLLAYFILSDALKVEVKGYNQTYSLFPAVMRVEALHATGLALNSKDLPPPFSPDLKPVVAEEWMDELRRSSIRQNLIKLARETTYFRITTAVEEDLMPAHKNQTVIPIKQFQMEQYPHGQKLRMKYIGKEALTNVVMLSLVRQTTKKDSKKRIPLQAIDLFNRMFGATDQQAKDAMKYLETSQKYSRMPKYASLYLPELKPGAEFTFAVGFMERGGQPNENSNSFALYYDQGHIDEDDISGFAVLPKPRTGLR